ncbi:TetR/AcrR family transcriptional regulator [Vibrio crassostreae]|uniref:TetR/AcrR family transcriptional regulator n=1 Tax=Vibrio crassostreae TaxID=246167 RepID=UPI000F47A83F|nr:TetR/AcrR family transcriptional regulator [Vibrio crassostreae]ROS66202.1 transcriptional regulator /TetR family transcriptional regulator [Vibrio crassostreae]RPF13871.1 transcriptional regulator /TetR family transcriptional regulator [Vibrio crassostreae]TCN86661.1 transcriptional regulator /TetR family transcriptional regulator [Vibrio crassostreae]TCT37358.1 transcriptional regulator /TetR family transcriptional regulator [Vibrio crassostreae]TCV61423.1 transcriptional regulator /TetR 
MTARKAGRPQKNLDVRQLLIEHARDLFVVQPYDKVSTRLIADRAGVNIAMIRYYFGSKAGLFEAMLRETLRPMQLQMQRLVEESSHENFLDLMRTYYKEMVKVPKFPRLIAQVMNMPPSEVQRELLEKVFLDVTKPAQDVIFEKLVAQGVLRKDMDPKLCRVSYISLMVFPFIAPPPLFAIHGIEINEEFLNRLIEHNIKLMTEGFINTPSPSSVQDQR